ncbi:HAMP domain-containing histidine kinase [Clostridium sp. SHJSY1]|uniref:HAMP domain-containing sensor histidine kinase n=1 Tax=Clostridium sp. SHJSY1 TaxID=2942483 RepID=UPI0028749779|nr:HAMP domain-containing sensor histidine kinase [Clostridium sp. SHJSY1]MDS0525147.1 HAMP domain-containing histidine kinase [Clostridium sp. SHJSY1]
MNTIRKRIFISHIIIISIFLFLTVLVFDLCLKVYIRKQVKVQLTNACELLKDSLNNSSENLKDIEKLKASENIIQNQLKNNSEQTLSIFDTKYALIGKDTKLIYANDEKSEEQVLTNHLIPQIRNKQLLSAENGKNTVLYLNGPVKKYALLLYPLKDNNSTYAYLTVYTNFTKSRRLTLLVNIMLISILLITSIIALIISNKVSKKISSPISALSEYAKRISQKDYTMKPMKYENHEIEKLSETMHFMAQKIQADDIFMKNFMQNSSHELRTPLMSIQGYAEAIKYKVIDDEAKAVDIIIEESKRLSEIVDDLLYLSKLDSMNMEFNFKRLNLEDIIKNSIERVNGIAVKNNKTITCSNNNKDLMLLLDEEKFTRAIINLLGNCLRYCNSYVNVVITKKLCNITVTITDDGPGFEDNDLPHIFDRFYKGKNGNHGLGLAIAKSIIENHKGYIVAENTSTSGACFRISFENLT